MTDLILYHYDGCYVCGKVHRTINSLGIQDNIQLKNTMQTAAYRSELRALTGRTQVPCLVIDGKPMLESNDIIAYLNQRFGPSTGT